MGVTSSTLDKNVFISQMGGKYPSGFVTQDRFTSITPTQNNIVTKKLPKNQGFQEKFDIPYPRVQYHGPTRHPDDGISNNNEILSGSAISGVADKSTSGAASEGSNYDKLMTINNI